MADGLWKEEVREKEVRSHRRKLWDRRKDKMPEDDDGRDQKVERARTVHPERGTANFGLGL